MVVVVSVIFKTDEINNKSEITPYYYTEYLIDKTTNTYYIFFGDIRQSDYIIDKPAENEIDNYIKLYDSKHNTYYYCENRYNDECYRLLFMCQLYSESENIFFVVPKSLVEDDCTKIKKEDYEWLYNNYTVCWIPRYIIPQEIEEQYSEYFN